MCVADYESWKKTLKSEFGVKNRHSELKAKNPELRVGIPSKDRNQLPVWNCVSKY